MSNAFTGVWRSGSDPYYLWVGVDWDNFRTKWEELSAKNLRLVDLDTYVVNNQRRWAGVWRGGSDGHYLWANADWDSFNAKWKELAAKNLRLTVLKVYETGSGLRYAGVWRQGSDPYYLWVGADWDSFKAKWEELSQKNLRLVDIETYVSGGTRRWAGVWRAGTGGHYLWVNASWDSFRAKWEELASQNLRLTVVKSYSSGGKRLYAGVWRPGNDAYYLWANASWESFQDKWQELAGKGLRLINLDTWWQGLTPTVRIHSKVLTEPNIPIDTMIDRMREVYESVGIHVQEASRETLNLPTLNDCDVGACVSGVTTTEQNQLFSNRNNVGENEITVYFVRSTVPPYNGCAAHPDGRPGAVVASGATQWTLAHEVGHVLGLNHVDNNNRLMTGNGTSNITNPPPDLIASEVETMKDSDLTINL